MTEEEIEGKLSCGCELHSGMIVVKGKWIRVIPKKEVILWKMKK